MDNELSLSVGARLRYLRRQRGLSQKDLAQEAGLSLNCISLIERDEISPNVATLQRLATALDVKMSYFFETDRQADVIHVKDLAPHPAATGSRVALAGICTSLAELEMQPFVLTLKPHACASASGGYAAQAGHGFVYCLKGKLVCDLDKEDYLLEPGEALLFEGALPRSWHNPGDEEVKFALVLQTAGGPLDSIGQQFMGHPEASSALR
jgi:transcriptional regulator with XRE-family HTH domain